MKSKSGVKLLFAMISMMGGAFALSSCGEQPVDNKDPIVQVESSTPTNTQTDTQTTQTTNSNDSTDVITDTSTTTETPDDTADKVNFEIKIESLLADKINNRFKEKTVSNVDAKYFTIANNETYGKTLETHGYVTLTETDQTLPVTLGLPVTAEQYQSFINLGFESYNTTGDLYQNYSKEQLSYACNVIDNKNVTYNFAVLDGNVWDLDQLTATKIETLLEEKYTAQVVEYFKQEMDYDYTAKLDFKYLKVENSDLYGNVLRIYGNTVSQKGTKLPLIVTLSVSENNFNTLKNVITNNYDENKELAQNYSKEQLYQIYQVDNNSSTKAIQFKINGVNYNIEYESENTL